MSLELLRELYDYHWWANRRLFDHVAGLGEECATQAIGSHFSVPSLLGMLAHIYGADAMWLARWKGSSPPALPGADIRRLAALRMRWDELEAEQRGFVESLTPEDLGRCIRYRNNTGTSFELFLGPLLHHVANHATHHRSEIATMITIVSGSPPDTGMV